MTAVARLSALDAAFLDLESTSVPFVVGSVLRFDRRVEIERLRAYVDAVLDRLPRYRQRLARVPLVGHPVWVDDEDFAVERHVLEVTDATGDPEQVAAERLTRPMPGGHPPWQLWLMDLPGTRSAIIALVHHSLVDGVAGMHLLVHLLRGVPDDTVPSRLARAPQPAPGGGAMLAAELRQRAANLRHIGRGLSLGPRRLLGALTELVRQGLRPAADIGLNPRRSGRERTVARCSFDLREVGAVRKACGATVNDVVLAVTTGALRRHIQRRGGDPDAAHDVRAMVPVSTNRPGDDAVSGNRVALLLAPLPVDEPDPVRRLERVRDATLALKGRSGERDAGELLVQVCDATTPRLLSAILRLALWRRGFNLVITNVAGPPFTLYLLGARLESIVPIVNLWPHGALGIAVASYGGLLHCGIDADRSILADLGPLTRDLVDSFGELARATVAVRPTSAPLEHPPEPVRQL